MLSGLNTLSPLFVTAFFRHDTSWNGCSRENYLQEKGLNPAILPCFLGSVLNHIHFATEVAAWPYSRHLPERSCSQQPKCKNEYWKVPSSLGDVKLYWKFITIGTRGIKPTNARVFLYSGSRDSLHTMQVMLLLEMYSCSRNYGQFDVKITKNSAANVVSERNP